MDIILVSCFQITTVVNVVGGWLRVMAAVWVPRDAGGHPVDEGARPQQHHPHTHQQRVPRELLAGILAPREPALVVEPPEEDGDQDLDQCEMGIVVT